MKYVWEHLEEFFIIPLMFAMSIIIFIQVIMRYVFQNSLTSTYSAGLFCGQLYGKTGKAHPH